MSIPSDRRYDAIVVGAGPAGCAAAIAHARRGAKVLLLEADPRAAKRFAGEWLHTTGVEVLDDLRIGHLEKARARAGYGFVIFPDDGSEPIELPYSSGVALSGEHSEIVDALRDAARGYTEIELCTDARAVHIADGVVRIEDRNRGSAIDVRAGRIIGADGRNSFVRKALGLTSVKSANLSHMAAVELRDVELPFEGFGHLVLGGPGPALFYRISDGVVRGCLDVPIDLGPGARSLARLWDGFSPVVPDALRPALRAALERGPSAWAVNRFRPRTEFGRDDVALVGDAIGHLHPMTAMGMTAGLLDARALAEAEDLHAYARERRGYVPELLSNALYHCFRRDDPSATAIRRAMFDTLRADPRERRRTMDILAAADLRHRSFGSAFLRIAAQAIGNSLGGGDKLSRLAGFGEWMQWPAALVVPPRLDKRVRARSDSTHPIPQLVKLVSSTAPIEAPSPGPAVNPRGVALGPAIERSSTLLLRELESIAMRFGEVPDAAIAGPALSCMRAIVATQMTIGMAARMSLGRRRLAVEGFARLLSSEPACVHLAELVLVLLDGAAWDELPIASLPEGVRALLDCQAQSGGFAPTREVAAAAASAGELELTALATRAINVTARRRPDASHADLGPVLDRAATWVAGLQGEDGSWGGDLSRSAWALEALMASRVHPGDPAARRAVRWLVEALPTSEDPVAMARALRALVAAGTTSNRALVEAAQQLTTIECDDWRTAREIVEGLAAWEAGRGQRPQRQRPRERPIDSRSPIDASLERDWAFCKESLGDVSRTFSRPIALLPPKLEVAVTLGYLLCRIADTVEDHVAVDPTVRDELFELFLGVLERGRDPRDFSDAFTTLVPAEHDDAELLLSRSLPCVLRVFAAQDEHTRDSSVRWVSEMARGMNLYGHRPPGDDGIVALHTVGDLERYCYYVAGTVGHMLTDLFIPAIGEEEQSAVALTLRDHAEGFATGLQLTNILKDVTNDLARGVSFVPRSECRRQGLGVASLSDPKVRERAHAAVAPLFDLAKVRLDSALEYALAIPPEHLPIRVFCLLPLFMAGRTLALARGNDAMFIPDAPVKIARAEVESLIAECMTHARDYVALRARYARLFETDAPHAERLRI